VGVVATGRELAVGAAGVAELVLLSPKRPIQVAKAVYEHDRDVGGGLLAGAIAFRLFVWAVALGVVLVGGLGWGRGASDSLDGGGATSLVFDTVDDVAESAAHTRWFFLLFGTWLLFSATRSAVRALWTSSSIVWRLPISRPPALQAIVAFNVVLCALFAVNGVSGALRDVTPGPGLLIRVLAAAVQLGILLVGLMWLPKAPVPLRRVVPGAALVAAGGQVMNLVATVYLPSRVESASETSGALGLAVALLAWVYLYARLLVLGSVLNATLWREGRTSGPDDDGAEHPEEDAALVAASLLTGAYDHEPRGTPVDEPEGQPR
jgi:uncharacterized BrkB/YihY/UPF0761 family membrane protein